MTTDLRYPIGRYEPAETSDDARRQQWINEIAAVPTLIREAVAGLTDEQLDTPYREGGWTVRQVVHHLADSHLNAYVRFKLALTEAEPLVKPYDEAAWATLPDARTAPVAVSLDLLDGLHARWVQLLRAMAPAEFARRFRHPEQGTMALDRILGLYAWHGRHHTAHITGLRKRMGW